MSWNPWTIIGMLLLTSILFRVAYNVLWALRYVIIAGIVAWLGYRAWKKIYRTTAPVRLEKLAEAYARRRRNPSDWPPPYPPPLDDVAQIIAEAGLERKGTQYPLRALEIIRLIWAQDFADRWQKVNPGLQTREEHLQAYIRTFGHDLSRSAYLHELLEARFRQGYSSEVTRAALETRLQEMKH